MYSDTTALEKIEALNKRINIIQGGTSAGKTISILIMLLDLSFEVYDKTIHIVSDTFPNLRHGAMKDWQKILKGTQRARYFDYKVSLNTWENKCTGTTIEFLSCDSEDALGARRDYLFINEANRITYETFRQLEVRTFERIWLDFNPANEFYAHTELMKRKDSSFIKLNYLDNEALPQSIVDSLEEQRGDGTSNWWRVYGLGEIGSLEGNVYEGWTTVDEIPEGYLLKRYGVDFGFSNDPTAVVAVYENEKEPKEVCLKLMLYENKLLTPDLIARLKQFPEGLFVCDSARPEIIAEMQANGLRAIACNKTPGEKMNGKLYNIELVKRRKVHYLSEDKALEREYLTYAWRKKKSTGETLDEPEDGNDHALDAIAYAIRDMERKPIEYGGVR